MVSDETPKIIENLGFAHVETLVELIAISLLTFLV